jgi:cellulose synthase/poly-beta-1,6-N-acetylglucosamine synthase-like glycosyltransferase
VVLVKFPSITVHVTVRNSSKTVKACVDSLLRLNYPNYNIIVTDAFSTDSTFEILKEYGNKIKLERVRGVAPRAHNYILRKVDTEFYAMTDADCVVDKNWLRNLLTAFKSKNVIAAGGLVKTPKNVNRLQTLIGRELENRYNHFPKSVSRFPTMNMMVKSSVAKRVKMDEKLNVAFETDWGFKLEKFGQLIYVPNAVVWHYHRGSLPSFFRQQMNYAKYAPQVYLNHKGKIKGDYISTRTMFMQEFLFLACAFLLILTIFSRFFLNYLLFSSFILLLAYIFNGYPLSKKPGDLSVYVCLFFVRNIAWTVGLIRSVF